MQTSASLMIHMSSHRSRELDGTLEQEYPSLNISGQ